MAYPPSSYGGRPSLQGFRRSSSGFTAPHRQLSVHERAGLDNSDADAGILYKHPYVRIFSFAPPLESINSRTTETHKDADYPIDTVETLPWRSRNEDLVTSGPLKIEKVRGSVPCFKRGDDFALPILRNSQCWCVDGESKFVVRKGKLQYYRFEFPTSSEEERKKVEELKTVLANALKYESTPCPFKRAFHVELPDDAITPRRKGKWKRREESLASTPEPETPPLRRSRLGRSVSMQIGAASPEADSPSARRGSDYGFVQTPRHTSLRTSYLADRPETPSSMTSSEDLARRNIEEEEGSDDASDHEIREVKEPQDMSLKQPDLPSPPIEVEHERDHPPETSKEALQTADEVTGKAAREVGTAEAPLDHVDNEPRPKPSTPEVTPEKLVDDVVSGEDVKPQLLEPAEGSVLDEDPKELPEQEAEVVPDDQVELSEQTEGSVHDEDLEDLPEEEVLDIPEGTFLPSTPELTYLEEHADLLEEHGFSDEELEPLAAAAHGPGFGFRSYAEPIGPEQNPSIEVSDDTESIASTTESFHTIDSGEPDGDIAGTSTVHHVDATPLAESRDPLGLSNRQHRRDLSEITVTASTFSGSPDMQDVEKFVTSEEMGLRPTTPRLIQSSASDDSWPDPITPSDLQQGLRQRLKSRRSLSPMPPSRNVFSGGSQNQGNHLTSAILKKACNVALVKPVEIVALLVHVLARIAGGATVNDLMSGELFKRPHQRRHSTSFPDQVARQPSTSDEDEDDFGVPIRGRNRSHDETAKPNGRDTDTDSIFDLD